MPEYSWEKLFQQSRRENQAAQRLRARGGVCDAPVDLDFGNNDYLNLRGDPAIRDAVAGVLRRFGWGSGASSVLNGYTSLHREAEASLARLTGCEDAMIFSAGYAGNFGSIASLVSAGDAVFSDQLNHACLIDGIRVSKAERFIYPHGDWGFVRRALTAHRHRFRRVLIVTESIFSMDGGQAPLNQLAMLAGQYDCGLVVDEAHATGLYGPSGGGLLEELNRSSSVTTKLPLVLKLGTLSKALGGIGGYAAGGQSVIEFLVNHCRSYLFSTAPPPAAMAATVAAVERVSAMSAERRELRRRSSWLREQLTARGFHVSTGDSPIVPVVMGGEEPTLATSQRLLRRGIYVPAIRPPTVPEGSSRLRISLSLRHSPEQLEQLLQALSDPR